MRRPHQPAPSAARRFALVGVAVLGACRVGPDYVPPEIELPDAWHRELTGGLKEGAGNLNEWWKLLGDPTLVSLVERARTGNLDLVQALGRVREARALRGLAAGDRYPSLEAGGELDRAGTGEDGSGWFREVGASASWELDVWGRVSRSVEYADANLQSTVEDMRDVLVSLYAEVATSYVDLRALQKRLELAAENLKLQQDTLELTQRLRDEGIVSNLDVAQAQLNLWRTKANVPGLRVSREAAIHRLSVLLGEPPGALAEELSKPAELPQLPDSAQVTLPFDLLRQRPDVRRAERDLAAQTAQIGIATAELYPQFSLDGSFTFAATSGGVDDLFDRSALAWSVGPSFQWRLFAGGAIRANIAAQAARADQLEAEYRQTVLLALEEVDNAIVAYTEELEAVESFRRSVDAAKETVRLVQIHYDKQLTDFGNVQDMQRSLTAQQDSLVQSEQRLVENLITLFRALGGGWGADQVSDEDSKPDAKADADSDPSQSSKTEGSAAPDSPG